MQCCGGVEVWRFSVVEVWRRSVQCGGGEVGGAVVCRSAVLHQQGRVEECVEDTLAAEALGLPPALSYKVGVLV